jgi:hypothetical protein
MSWPAILLWSLTLPMLFSTGPVMLYMLNIVGVFMSLQMLPGDPGGANLLPVTIYAAILVCKVACGHGNLMRALEAALDPRRLGLFTAFTIYAILSAIALPRIFTGLIEVIPVSGAGLNGGSWLLPRSGNITQPCYMLISYLTALAFAVIGSRRDVRHHYMQALVWGGFALILTGILDLVSYHGGVSALLAPFRTASYELLTDVETVGAKRVVGLTPEASTYGSLCVSAAASILFLRPLYPEGWSRLAATCAFLGLVVVAGLSTSSTAFAGGGVVGCVYLFDLARRVLDRRALGRDILGWEIGVLVGVGVIAFGVAALMPDRLAPLFDVLDKVIFQKTASFSYYQRSLWTRVGWQAFLDSGGLGVGLGSVRTSNWAVSILGSTGFIGGLLIFGFLLQKLTTSTTTLSRQDATFSGALKMTILPFLAMSSLGGTIPDIGVGVATTLGLLSARIQPSSKRDSIGKCVQTCVA